MDQTQIYLFLCMVAAILNFEDFGNLIFNINFSSTTCSHPPKWKLEPHLFLKLFSLQNKQMVSKSPSLFCNRGSKAETNEGGGFSWE